jgi:phosphoribosylaminoimidazole-succinocarboxamide synthase
MTVVIPGLLLHEGKAKRVHATDHPDLLAVDFKDDATAFNAEKRASLAGKGLLNCRISALLFEYLKDRGVPTHYLGVQNRSRFPLPANADRTGHSPGPAPAGLVLQRRRPGGSTADRGSP